MFGNYGTQRRIPGPIKFIFILGLAAIFVYILGNLIAFLWNAVLVPATGFNIITFWQAVGIFVLARILFGAFRIGPKKRPWRGKGRRWGEKWRSMSEEERAAFRARWKERCR